MGIKLAICVQHNSFYEVLKQTSKPIVWEDMLCIIFEFKCSMFKCVLCVEELTRNFSIFFCEIDYSSNSYHF